MVSRSPSKGQSKPVSRTCGWSVADVHHPLLAEEVERGGPAFAVAEARVLHTAEGNLCLTAECRDVHVEHPGLRFLRVAERGAEIGRVDRRRNAVSHRIRCGKRRLELVRRDQAHDTAEDLLLRERS